MKRNFVYDVQISKIVSLRNFSTTLHLKATDLYKVLGVSKDSSHQDIKEAYFNKAKLVHPDSLSSSNHSTDAQKIEFNKKFIDIKFAYDILKKPATRKLYDNGIDPIFIQQGQTSNKSKENLYTYYAQYHNINNDRSAFYKQNFNCKSYSEEFKKRDKEQWRRILIFFSVGFIIVSVYNLGYYMLQLGKENNLKKLIKKDEIARSYIRQSNERENLNNREELDKYGKLFYEDIEASYRRRAEEFTSHNLKEIQE